MIPFLQGLATGVMGQVQGIIPGMKKEEEVPDPAAMQQGEEVYQDQQYYDQVIFLTGNYCPQNSGLFYIGQIWSILIIPKIDIIFQFS